jgi:hypothetical protein
MPEYTFEAHDGATVTRCYEMSEAPKLGARIRVKGKTYRRVPDYGRGGGAAMVEPDLNHATWALTKQQAKAVCTEFDSMGHGLLRTRKQIANAEAKLQAMGIPMRYDHGVHGLKRGKRIA